MTQPTTIGSVAELQQRETDMLATINGVPHGAELFLADPFRFLNEHGYTVSCGLQSQLVAAAPALAKAPKQRYDGIAAGRASFAGDYTVNMVWHIRSLGVKL